MNLKEFTKNFSCNISKLSELTEQIYLNLMPYEDREQVCEKIDFNNYAEFLQTMNDHILPRVLTTLTDIYFFIKQPEPKNGDGNGGPISAPQLHLHSTTEEIARKLRNINELLYGIEEALGIVNPECDQDRTELKGYEEKIEQLSESLISCNESAVRILGFVRMDNGNDTK